jgi:hypothetical protein
MTEIKCPICKGTGKLFLPNQFLKVELNLHLTAKALRKEGYSIREISKLLGLEHPGSVAHLLK